MIEIPTAPTTKSQSRTVTSPPDDAELFKDLKGLDKPPLFDENDADVRFFLVSEDDSFLLRHMDDVEDTSADKCRVPQSHGRNGQPKNQHTEIPHIQYTDKIADKSVAVQRQISPRNIYLDLDGLDDVTEDALKTEFTVSLTVVQSRASSEFSRSLAWRTPRRKEKQTFYPNPVKKEEKTSHKIARRFFNEGGSRGRHSNSNTNITFCVNQTTL